MSGGIYGTPIQLKPRQVAASNLRFGEGVTAEVGMDLKNMKARKARTRPPVRSPSIIGHVYLTLGRSLY